MRVEQVLSFLSAFLFTGSELPPDPAEQLIGTYDGVMKSPKASFDIDSADVTFEVGDSIIITQDHFFGSVCEYEGDYGSAGFKAAFPLRASGSYRCSDFSKDSWSSVFISKTSSDSHVTILEVTEGSQTYSAVFTGFSLQDTGSDVDVRLKAGELSGLAGNYEGVMKRPEACAGSTFPISGTELTVSRSGNELGLVQDSFQEGECRYTGEITSQSNGSLAASGTLECSNFDQGTWSSNVFGMTSSETFLAVLDVSIPSRGCDYQVKYSGIRQ